MDFVRTVAYWRGCWLYMVWGLSQSLGRDRDKDKGRPHIPYIDDWETHLL